MVLVCRYKSCGACSVVQYKKSCDITESRKQRHWICWICSGKPSPLAPLINEASFALVSSAVGILFTRIWKHLERAREPLFMFCRVIQSIQGGERDCQAPVPSMSLPQLLLHTRWPGIKIYVSFSKMCLFSTKSSFAREKGYKMAQVQKLN